MSTSPIAQLSQELVDNIIDTLARISSRPSGQNWWQPWMSWTDLNACSLVCSSFRARAQMHLFRVIAIKDFSVLPARNRKLSRLQDALAHNPGLAKHMRQLELINSEDGFRWAVRDDSLLLPILRFASREGQGFQKLTLNAVGEGCAGVVDSGAEIFKVLGSQLKSLSLCFFQGTGRLHPSILTHLPNIAELSLFNVDPVFDVPVVQVGFPKLEVLTIVQGRWGSVKGLLAVQDLAEIAAESLQELHMTLWYEIGYNRNFQQGAFELARCRSLHRFEVTVVLPETENGIGAIVNILRAFPDGSHALRELHLSFTRTRRRHVSIVQDVVDLPWEFVGKEIDRICGGGSGPLRVYMCHDMDRGFVEEMWIDAEGGFGLGYNAGQNQHLAKDEQQQEVDRQILLGIQDKMASGLRDRNSGERIRVILG